MKWKEVLFRKPDLDTLVSALVCGVDLNTPKRAVQVASEEELADPEILCLEVGGSGRIETNNFDHHDPDLELPPACVQAWDKFKSTLEERFDQDKLRIIEMLVDYTSALDEGRISSQPFPALSHIISGILLVEKDQITQFEKGLSVLLLFLEEKLNPYNSLAESKLVNRPDIQRYLQAKRENQNKLQEDFKKAYFFTTKSGILAGVLVTEAVGGHGYLYSKGANIVLLYNPVLRKFTISSKEISLFPLLQALLKMEEGWGGRKTIIGSPPSGSKLSLAFVIELIKILY